MAQATHFTHCLREHPRCSACEEFLAVLAHELRSPLASINTGLELLKTTTNDPEIIHEVHEIMQRQLSHLTALIDELFDISRVTGGTFAMKSQQVNVKSVVERAAAVTDAGYLLTIELPDEPSYVDGDPDELVHLISNLVDNATKRAPRGGLIRVAARREDEILVLTVTAGEGQGAASTIRLPVSSAEQAGASGLRILIVDDNRPAADMLAMILESYGNELFIAYSGLQAIQLAETHRPDVILLDLSMPVVDGYEVARTIRRQPRGQEPMLVALTGWERDKQKARDAGFDHHVVKPTKAADLRGILSQAKRRTGDSRATITPVRL